jgi:5-methylcytosine-specific restriction protein A
MVKTEYIVFIITAVLIVNTYYDGHLIKIFQSNQKWIKMATFGFVGLSLFMFLRRNPENSRQLFYHANDIIKYMPISKGTADMITPFFDMTGRSAGVPPPHDGGAMSGAMSSAVGTHAAQPIAQPSFGGGHPGMSAAEKRVLNSGKGSSKRSVSETKKKYVAAQQGWKCGDCQRQLPAWFEVDHVIALEHGGSNHVDNLVALCRDCHGKKTAMSFL